MVMPREYGSTYVHRIKRGGKNTHPGYFFCYYLNKRTIIEKKGGLIPMKRKVFVLLALVALIGVGGDADIL